MRNIQPFCIMCIMGYALHLFVVTVSAWNGALLYLVDSARVEEVLPWANAAQLVSFPASFLLGALLSWKVHLEQHAERLTAFALAASIAGFAAMFFAASSDVPEGVAAFGILGGTFTGLGGGAFFLAWQNVLAAQGTREMALVLTCGTAFAGVAYFLMVQTAGTIAPLATMMLSLFATFAILLKATRTLRSQGAFVYADAGSSAFFANKELVSKLWQPAMCIAALALARGVVPGLVLGGRGSDQAASISLLAAGAMVTAAVLFAVLLKYTKILDCRADKMYSSAVVLVATGFILLPMLGEYYQLAFSIVIYIIFSMVSLLMMQICAHSAREYGMRPLLVYGCFAGFVYIFWKTGFAMGYYPNATSNFGLPHLTMIALVTVYILLIVLFASRRHRREQSASEPNGGSDPQSAKLASLRSVLHDECQRRAEEAGLSVREAEVMELLAAGRNVPYIAESLFISENTVRTHCKSIYRKLDIHSKSELLDLLRGKEAG